MVMIINMINMNTEPNAQNIALQNIWTKISYIF